MGNGSSVMGTTQVSWKRIASILLPVLMITVWVLVHSNLLLGRALLVGFSSAESRHGLAMPNLAGGLSSKQVMVYPYGDMASAVTFQRIHMKVPFTQWLRSLFSRNSRNALGSIRAMTLEMHDVRSLGDIGVTDALLWFGDASASPMEAMGCMEDAYWIRDELAEMGLPAEPTTLRMEYDLGSSQGTVRHILSTPGVSSAEVQLQAALSGKVNLLDVSDRSSSVKWQTATWRIVDQGFIKARNTTCARSDGVSPELVAERHVAGMERMLLALGVRIDDRARELYRRFAQDGGELVLTVRFSGDIHQFDLEDLAQWSRYLQGHLSLNGETVALGLAGTPARDFPEAYYNNDDTLAQMMRKEGTLPMRVRGVGETLDMDSGPVVEVVGDEAVDAAAVMQPVESTRDSGRDAGSLPGTGNRWASRDGGRASSSPTGTAAAGPAVRGTVAATSAKAAAATTEPEAPAEPLFKVGDEVRYRDLGKLVGARIRVHSFGAQPRVVEIVSARAGSVQVRQRAGAGWASYDLKSSAFERGQVLAVAPGSR